jgi:WD40 repeat protein
MYFQQVAFLPDGKRVVALGDDYLLRIWEVESGKLLATAQCRAFGAASFVLSPDGKRALLIGKQSLGLWDLENNEEVRTLALRYRPRVPGVGGVSMVRFSSDGRQVHGMAFGEPGPGQPWDALVTWDTDSGRLIRTCKVDDGTYLAAWSADGGLAVTAVEPRSGFGTILHLWDLAGARRLRTLESAPGSVRFLEFSPDSRLAVADCTFPSLPQRSGPAGHDFREPERALLVWDLPTGKLIKTFGRHHEANYQFAHFIADGSKIIAGTNRWQVWDVRTGDLLDTWRGTERFDVEVDPYGTVFSKDDKRAITYGAKLQLWDLTTGGLLQTWAVRPDRYHMPFTAAALSADGKWALSAGGPEALIQLWDVGQGRVVRSFVGRSMPGEIRSLAFSPDGKQALAGGEHLVQLWDVSRGRDIRNLVLEKVP